LYRITIFQESRLIFANLFFIYKSAIVGEIFDLILVIDLGDFTVSQGNPKIGKDLVAGLGSSNQKRIVVYAKFIPSTR
jgi:hypothetical protein